MHQLVQDLMASGQFDLILFDTPPVLGIADASLVAEHCDGLMLLVSLNQVDRALPKESVARIRSSGAPLLGVVTNAIKESIRSNQKYGYGQYGYGYNKYGYGYAYGGYETYSAYAIHSQDSEEQNYPDKNTNRHQTSAANALTDWRNQWRRKRHKFMQWLDS